MKRRELTAITLLLLLITGLFFHRTLRFGSVPLPADSLVSDFQPWRSASYLGYAAGGIPNKAQYPDVIRQLYPWKTLVVSALREGRLPLWNPYNFSGAPLLANFQSAALYPANLLYLFLSQATAWTVLTMLQPLLAAWCTYLYMRKIKANIYGSLLAAVSYGFSGFMAVWLEYNTVGHVILWLPVFLLSAEQFRQGKKRRLWFVVLAASHAAALLAGHPQVYAYAAAYSLVYAYVRLPRRAFLHVVWATALGVGTAGIQLLPGLELIRLAARSPHNTATLMDKILIQPWQLLALPFPNIFGNPATRTYWPSDTFVGKVTTIGLVPLFFLLSALRRKDAATRWHTRAAAVTLILVTATPVTAILYRMPIPLLSASSPTLMTFLFSFSLAAACGLGLDYWMTDRHSVRKLIRRTAEVGAVLGVLFLSAKLPLLPSFSAHAATAVKALAYGGAIAAATLFLFLVAITRPKYMRHVAFLFVMLTVADLFVFFARFNPFVPRALIFPEHAVLDFLKTKAPDRYWGYGTANIAANFASEYGIFSPEGYDPLYPASYGRYLYSYKNGKPLAVFDDTTRSDAAISSSFGDGGASDRNKQSVLNALSVRYVLDRTENGSTADTFPTDIFRKSYDRDGWIVYENMHAKPRAYLTHGTADILRYEPEHVTIRTHSNTSALLTLTDTYYPGWAAAVDGKPAAIRRTDASLRAVDVPAGTHIVSMEYMPQSVKMGTIMTVASLIAVCASLFFL